VMPHFIVELARPPSGKAQRHQPALRPAPFGNGAEQVDRGRDHA